MKNREPKMLQWFLTHKTTSEKHFNQHQGRKEKRINQHKGWKGRTLNSTNEKSNEKRCNDPPPHPQKR